MKRLVPFVEGRGDLKALPALLARLVLHLGVDSLFVDTNPFRVQNLGKLFQGGGAEWQRLVTAAVRTRHETGAILLILDGDVRRVSDMRYIERFGDDHFCAFRVAAHLADLAKGSGAGSIVSVAAAFAMREMESWAVSTIDGLAEAKPSDELEIPVGIAVPENPEAMNDAKGWLKKALGKYKPTLHQLELAQRIPIDLAIKRSRSFRRLANAVSQLNNAVREGTYVCSPQLP